MIHANQRGKKKNSKRLTDPRCQTMSESKSWNPVDREHVEVLSPFYYHHYIMHTRFTNLRSNDLIYPEIKDEREGGLAPSLSCPQFLNTMAPQR